MKVGDQFSTYKEFVQALTVYKTSVLNEFWIRDARTLTNQKKRFPETVNKCNNDLKYYYIRLACVKGGRPFQAKNENSLRKTTTLKQDCKASIFLRLSKCQKYLTVVELNPLHNHRTSKKYFTSLSQQRLKLPEDLKQETKQLLKLGANKKLVLNKIQSETGCKITLKDLTNLSKKEDKKSLEDCVALLQGMYKCESVEVLIDSNGVFKGLYFQDERMKKYFESFPEVLFADGTYCLVDLRTATYLLMVEDGNGLSEIVAVCLLVEENEEALNFFIQTFKENNDSWSKVKVIMSDKDRTERKVFFNHFPQTKLMICLFHVFQIFNREVSSKKMGITSTQVQKSKSYLQKLSYAKSEAEYNAIYSDMCENVPSVVRQYFDENWAPIKEQWVKCYTFKNLCLSNSTNNRLESLNSKLKSVISRYSTLEDFIKHMFAYINSYRTGKDVKLSQELNKRLAKAFVPGSPEELYSNFLTTFAYQKVEEQLQLKDSCKTLIAIQETTYLVTTSEGLLHVTPTECECMFFNANKLPCRHIFKCRQTLSLNLFDEKLCLERWTRIYAEQLLQNCETQNADFSENNPTTDVVIKKTSINTPKTLSSHKKFKIMDENCKKMATLCSEVSTPVFHKRMELIQSIIRLWSEGKDVNLCELSAEHTTSTEVQIHLSPIFMEANSLKKDEVPKSISTVEQEKNKSKDQVTKPITEKERYLEVPEELDGRSESEENVMSQTETGEVFLEEEYLEQQFLHGEEYLELEYLEDNNEENLSQLKNIIMPPVVRKRGRPKGCGNTVIGLKRKK